MSKPQVPTSSDVKNAASSLPAEAIVIKGTVTRYYDAQGKLHREDGPFGEPRPAVVACGANEYWNHGVQYSPDWAL